MPNEPLISTGELASALGVSVKTIQRYRQAGIIEPAAVLVNGHARWNLSEVREILSRPRKGQDKS